jgi:hypothetical protein
MRSGPGMMLNSLNKEDACFNISAGLFFFHPFSLEFFKIHKKQQPLFIVKCKPKAEPNAALDTVGRQNIPHLSFVSLQCTSV